MTPYNEAIADIFSLKEEKLETCHWHVKLPVLGLLPTEMQKARIGVGINWHDVIK